MPSRSNRVLAALSLVVVLVSGCSTPVSVDLTDGWPRLAEPARWQPEAGSCFQKFTRTTSLSTYQPVDCAKSHFYEVVHVGQFPADATAGLSSTSALAAARTECETNTSEFLGGSWQSGKVLLTVSVPSDDSWQAGGRWFQCGIAVTGSVFGPEIPRAKSLKGELAGDSPVKLACFLIPATRSSWSELGCTQTHNGEYAGSYLHPGPDVPRDTESNNEATRAKCRPIVAAYVGVPNDRNLDYRIGTAFWVPGSAAWGSGDRFVRCFAYLYPGTEMARSVKGAGTKALPIN